MNGRKAKAIRRQAKENMVEWLKSLLDGEEKNRINTRSIFKYAPKQTHITNFGTTVLSIYSYKWFIKILKQNKNWKDFNV